MVWIFAIIGTIIGADSRYFPGFATGGLFGFLLGIIYLYKKRLDTLDAKVQQLELKQLAVEQKDKPSEFKKPEVNKELTEVETTIDKSETIDALVPTMASAAKPSVPEQIQKPISHSSKEPTKEDKPQSRKSINNVEDKINHIINSAFALVKKYFLEGNMIVSIGTVVLFFGVSFLIKYSIDNSLIPIELRLTSLVIGSIIMLVIGWKLRMKSPGYALIMQGGAVAISYLTIFASFKMYQIVPVNIVFPVLIIFSALAMFLAVAQNSKALAVTAIAGGFATPILTSTGSGNYIGLFSYYLVLNFAVFGVSWFKSWRLLNLVGFAFTFIISSFWVLNSYKVEYFSTTEPFLISYFLIYVMVSILFAIKQKPELKGYVDGTLIFGLPIIVFSQQAVLLQSIEYGLAISALVLGFFYLIIAKLLWNNTNSNFRLLCEAMLALGVIFTTLTIPLALDGQWTAASWAIEGAGLLWIGIRQQRSLVKYFGMLIQIAGSFLFLIDYPYVHDVIMFLNSEFIGSLMVAVAALYSAYLLTKEEGTDNKKNIVAFAFLVWSMIWWYTSGIMQILKHSNNTDGLAIYTFFISISALLWFFLNHKLPRKIFNFHPWLLMLPLWCLSLIEMIFNKNIFANYGYLTTSFALVVAYSIYYLSEKSDYELAKPTFLHSATYLLITAIILYEISWYLDKANFADAWIVSAMALILIAALTAINKMKVWPFIDYEVSYQKITARVLIVGLVIWTVFGNFSAFLPPSPLPYITLLNPIDLMQAFAILAVVEWFRNNHGTNNMVSSKAFFLGAIGSFVFVWFNVIMFKTIHSMTGVRYTSYDLFNSATVQMAVSISWTLIGLTIMMFSSKKMLRNLWFSGAALAVIVVIKLFILDLAEKGTIERIVTFMIVGILLLVVGYFSPVPPNNDKYEKEAEN